MAPQIRPAPPVNSHGTNQAELPPARRMPKRMARKIPRYKKRFPAVIIGGPRSSLRVLFAVASPWLCEVGKFGQERLVVLQWIRPRLWLDRSGIPHGLVAQGVEVVFPAVRVRPHIQKKREEPGRDLIFEAPSVRPRAGSIHIDCAKVRD